MNGQPYKPPSVFIVDGSGEVTKYSASWQLDAAMDILLDARMLNEKRLRLLMVAEQTGKDPEALARKLVMLAGVLKVATR